MGLAWLVVGCLYSPANIGPVVAVALQQGGAQGAVAVQALVAVAAGGGTAMNRRSSIPSTGQVSSSIYSRKCALPSFI
jgi:hypothetical protein